MLETVLIRVLDYNIKSPTSYLKQNKSIGMIINRRWRKLLGKWEETKRAKEAYNFFVVVVSGSLVLNGKSRKHHWGS